MESCDIIFYPKKIAKDIIEQLHNNRETTIESLHPCSTSRNFLTRSYFYTIFTNELPEDMYDQLGQHDGDPGNDEEVKTIEVFVAMLMIPLLL